MPAKCHGVTTFESDPDVLGKPVRLGSEAVTVFGAMPSDFGFPHKQTIWQVVPAGRPRLANGEVVARLNPAYREPLPARISPSC